MGWLVYFPALIILDILIYGTVLSIALVITLFLLLWSGTDKESIWLMLQRSSTCSLRKRSNGFSNSSISLLSFSSHYFGMVTTRRPHIHQKVVLLTYYSCICVLLQVDLLIIGGRLWIIGVDTCSVDWFLEESNAVKWTELNCQTRANESS